MHCIPILVLCFSFLTVCEGEEPPSKLMFFVVQTDEFKSSRHLGAPQAFQAGYIAEKPDFQVASLKQVDDAAAHTTQIDKEGNVVKTFISYGVSVALKDTDIQAFTDFTAHNSGRYIAVFLDGQFLMEARLLEAISNGSLKVSADSFETEQKFKQQLDQLVPH